MGNEVNSKIVKFIESKTDMIGGGKENRHKGIERSLILIEEYKKPDSKRIIFYLIQYKVR